MLNKRKKVVSMTLIFAMIFSLLNLAITSTAFADDNGGPEGPGGPGGGPSTSQTTTTKTSEKYGNWKFTVTTTTDSSVSPSKVTKTAKITQYIGTTDTTVVVPGVLDGATVTEIGSQAFARHGEILALYVPNVVKTIDSWAFYDCNSVAVVSIANADVNLDTGAFQSNPNVVVYLNSSYSDENTNKLVSVLGSSDKVSRKGYTGITVDIKDSEDSDSYTAVDKTLYGTYGEYLSVNSYPIEKTNISIISRGTGCTVDSGNFENNIYTYTISGDLTGVVDYTSSATVADSLKDKVKVKELNKTFRVLTAEEASTLNGKISSDSNYSTVKSRFNFNEGYYINGNQVKLDSKNVTAYDAEKGDVIYSLVNGTVTKGELMDANYYDSNLYYKYIAYKDTDNDGDVDVIYYSPFELSANEDTAAIADSNVYLNGLSSQKEMNPVYYSFANSVITADGEDLEYTSPLSLKSTDTSFKYTDKDGNSQTYKGDSVLGKTNEERSILWATNYGNLTVSQLNAKSNSVGNWAKMSYEAGLSTYNPEIVMQWGMNAVLYATQGGTVTLGKKGGSEHSSIAATGDGANGVIAACGGADLGSNTAKSSTSKVYVYNTDFNLEGWNNHVADCVYGGYAYLENVTAKTGRKGSYAVGQGSSLANDFGNGVVEVNNYKATVYGNRSAGAYVIGSGVISGDKAELTSYADAGAVIASGGTYHLSNSEIKGVMGIKNRGGAKGTSDISNSTITAFKDYSEYTIGDKAKSAMEAWKTASGSYALAYYMMSDETMTMGKLCENYNITGETKTTLYNTLGKLEGATYTDNKKIRKSVLDNTYYNYSAGSYTGSTDFSDIPYLTVGSSYGGNTNSILDFEASGTTLNLTGNKYINKNTSDYDYLISSEAGSSPTINFIDSNGTVSGIVWNEGTVNRAVEGRGGSRTSSVTANFKNSNFEGSFADGNNGLWNGNSEYTNNAGNVTKLNGNYYGAEANWGITASFDANSKWNVTHDSYVGTLTIENLDNVSSEKPVKVYYKNLGTGTDSRLTNGTVKNNITFVLE
ncbi:leucine-rich repeat protein [Clostridium sp. SHJSY1]|uniref:leucine-rich repeat protein n=1 Tax=Clostridium sp. SHJSY1 TaxID=2942483 RepID=UPI002875C723|nr:leucine-rich repeat protein [Clostridium sp. SHJSY1]MDS0527769.1 leucine-rich repeat protein [Clostridium sp. SHJSY1]